jgi:non-specific serine/threonine protein kinase/serine/threonine-protein kinase
MTPPADSPAPDPDAPTVVPPDGSALPPGVPRRIGRYTIQSLVATGGMGTVYKAVQESPRRVVAVKVMKAGVASGSALRRFEYESQLLGRLRHPGIAQVYEAGTHEDGTDRLPFFAMEYIPNAKEITAYARQKKLGTREKLALFAEACDAVHHGHQKGIVHRDLKPSNILIGPSGTPKIIDFGVARATDSDLALTVMQTNVGQLLGTVQYMSPEQCEADPDDIDIRSDVYALGVTLYELLCGRLPYEIDRAPVFEATRIIRERNPARPSTVNSSLRGDVETIVLKALEKDRDRRYQSAAELARDLRSFLAGEAILARPSSVFYQFRVFARRNKAMIAAGVAMLAIMIVSTVAITAVYFQSTTNRLRAEQEKPCGPSRRPCARRRSVCAPSASARGRSRRARSSPRPRRMCRMFWGLSIRRDTATRSRCPSSWTSTKRRSRSASPVSRWPRRGCAPRWPGITCS